MKSPSVVKFSEKGILFNWNESPSIVLTRHIQTCAQILRKEFTSLITDVVISYYELAVYTKKNVSKEISKDLLNCISNITITSKTEKKVITIPVCYQSNYALDIEEFAKKYNYTSQEFIKKHTEAVYTVAFIGFLPGFPYLHGLHADLHMPRKKHPRPFVEKGSVAIGGAQTGIYPMDSPGGWNIIGKIPIELFNPNNENPTLLSTGDQVKFKSISSEEYGSITEHIANRSYKLNWEVIDD